MKKLIDNYCYKNGAESKNIFRVPATIPPSGDTIQVTRTCIYRWGHTSDNVVPATTAAAPELAAFLATLATQIGASFV